MPLSHPHLIIHAHICLQNCASTPSPTEWLLWQKSSVGQHFIPQWISPGTALDCSLVTCRTATTQLLLLEALKIRCNCTDKPGDCAPPNHATRVFTCVCVSLSWKVRCLFWYQRYVSVKLDFSFWSGWRATPPLSCAEVCSKIAFYSQTYL